MLLKNNNQCWISNQMITHLTYSWPHEPISPSEPNSLYFKLSWNGCQNETNILYNPVGRGDIHKQKLQKKIRNHIQVKIPLQWCAWRSIQNIQVHPVLFCKPNFVFIFKNKQKQVRLVFYKNWIQRTDNTRFYFLIIKYKAVFWFSHVSKITPILYNSLSIDYLIIINYLVFWCCIYIIFNLVKNIKNETLIFFIWGI